MAYYGDIESILRLLGKQINAPLYNQAGQQTSDFSNLLLQLTGQANIPQLPAEYTSWWDENINRQMDKASELINRQLRKTYGDINAMAGAKGVAGSTMHASAYGQANARAIDALTEFLLGQQQKRSEALEAMRQALMQAQTQRLGIGAQFYPTLTGQQLELYGLLSKLVAEKERQEQEAWGSILDMLGNIGGASILGILMNRNKQ